MQPVQSLLPPGAWLHESTFIEIEHPQIVLLVYLQVIGIHVRVIDAYIVEMMNRRPDRRPKAVVLWRFGYYFGQRPDARNTYR